MRKTVRLLAFAATLGLSSPVLAADLDTVCVTLRDAAIAGPAAAEQTAYEIGKKYAGATGALLQEGCNGLLCVYVTAPPEIADAIARGIIRSGNEDLAACIADSSPLSPNAIDISPN